MKKLDFCILTKNRNQYHEDLIYLIDFFLNTWSLANVEFKTQGFYVRSFYKL